MFKLKDAGTIGLVVGVLVLAYAGFVWTTNEPVEITRPKTIGEALRNGNLEINNIGKARERERARQIAVIGALIVVGGVVVVIKGRSDEQKAAPQGARDRLGSKRREPRNDSLDREARPEAGPGPVLPDMGSA